MWHFFHEGGIRVTRNNHERITVEIYNRTYTIKGTESAQHVRLVASLVDQKMRDIQNRNPGLDTTKLAVLTAVNSMNDYMKLKEDYATLMGKLKQKED
ncbi:cell division protein ZapA [Lentibacillus saliphilus]|uniref:cell division protein ZapA n=1 Tax=Lentibacillus saliphilus TaxID=2737028 RepID=UPI001FE68989|nr:cell division protein ZapA [Lentibacillus saliphilus]